MKNNQINIKLHNDSHEYAIEIGHDLLKTSGEWARRCLMPTTNKIALISNPKVFSLYGAAVKKSFESQDFEVVVFLMKDGERYKNFRTVENALEFFSANNLTRTSAAVALGGGVVGDVAGFAAAIFLRGIAFLQIPTTLLAMIDSSVGGKTGVNSDFGKNLIGAFHQPNGVLVDVETLRTLATRELIAGFCEAVKQAAISDAQLFAQTGDFLDDFATHKFKRYFSDANFINALENLIAAQIAFKAAIVMQDEREDVARTDGKSRKILNFGHTLAHALEKITDYKRFKHGEAVGIGVLFAAELSKRLDILDKNELKSLNDVLQSVGRLPDTGDINLETVLKAFAFDKKVVGKSLQWILLKQIGQPVIVENQNISTAVIKETLEKVLHHKPILKDFQKEDFINEKYRKKN